MKRIPISELHPHPKNPRLAADQDVVNQIAKQIEDGFDDAHALIVRQNASGYEVISGHHRLLAATKVGIDAVPCWVRDMSDDEAYMQLVLCNTQSELHPLEEGKHAAESGMDLKAYAGVAGKARQTLQHKLHAYRVLSNVPDVGHADMRDNWMNLAAIHAAPQWLWPAMVKRMLSGQWTFKTTRVMVANIKDTPDPQRWADIDAIAAALTIGHMTPGEVGRMNTLGDPENTGNGIRDADLIHSYAQALIEAKPARQSDVQQILAEYRERQEQRDAESRRAEIEKQRTAELAEKRIATLRANVSLDEWKTLSVEEQTAILTPTSSSGTFNKQEGSEIEWAQWSWNPVTGCKHGCPYCYARDIAMKSKMAKVYPNGFEPSFRSNALNAPAMTKVPPEAAADTRYRNVFTCSMSDLFGRWVPAEWINAILDAVRANEQWNFLFLTKFPQRLQEFDIPDNAWMGTTVDLQARVAGAEKAFENVGGRVKWLSVEPMIEPLKFRHLDRFDWVVIGGSTVSRETLGTPATPAWQPPYRWVEDLVRQCDNAGAAIYFKTNLGISNRILGLPFDAPISAQPQTAPSVFHYLGTKK